jgi:hypothetical protein
MTESLAVAIDCSGSRLEVDILEIAGEMVTRVAAKRVGGAVALAAYQLVGLVG